jgi:hypothetical protein
MKLLALSFVLLFSVASARAAPFCSQAAAAAANAAFMKDFPGATYARVSLYTKSRAAFVVRFTQADGASKTYWVNVAEEAGNCEASSADFLF